MVQEQKGRERESERESGLERGMIKRPEWEHFCPCHFNLGIDNMSQSRRWKENEPGKQHTKHHTQTHTNTHAHLSGVSHTCSEACESAAGVRD